jgi:hypothetical protein
MYLLSGKIKISRKLWVNVRVTRCACKKVAQNVAQSIFVIINAWLLPFKEVAQVLLLLLKFSPKIPKETSHPIGENSHNLVTLVYVNI